MVTKDQSKGGPRSPLRYGNVILYHATQRSRSCHPSGHTYTYCHPPNIPTHTYIQYKYKICNTDPPHQLGFRHISVTTYEKSHPVSGESHTYIHVSLNTIYSRVISLSRQNGATVWRERGEHMRATAVRINRLGCTFQGDRVEGAATEQNAFP